MHSLLGDIFGFDPARLMNVPGQMGVEIERTDNGYRIEIPVAGFAPGDINVSVEDRQLTVQGQNDRRRFTRQIGLPDEIDDTNIDAHVEHGMLTLTLPLHAKMRPRQIQVRVGGGGEMKNVSGGGGVPTMSGESEEVSGEMQPS